MNEDIKTAVKQISIKDFLEKNSVVPVRDFGSYGLYHAPYREDKNPSMTVNYEQNRWLDLASGSKGDIIDLVQKINNTDFKGALQILKSQSGLAIYEQPTTSGAKSKPESESRIIVHSVMELRSPELLSYLQERHIDLSIAKKMCKELFYEVRKNGKSDRYHGVGFQNDRGGWEIRSKAFKGCTSKDITTINDHSSTGLVFEGFTDYLSYLTLNKQGFSSPEWYGNAGEDVLILNSTTLLNRAKDFLSKHTANICFLDNDNSGRATLKAIKDMGLPVINASNIYKDHKDLNEFHQSLPMPKQQQSQGRGAVIKPC